MGLINYETAEIYIRVPRTGSTRYIERLARAKAKFTHFPGPSHPRAIELSRWFRFENFHKYGYIRNPWDWYEEMWWAKMEVGGVFPINYDSFTGWLRDTAIGQMWWLADDGGKVLVNEIRLAEEEWAGRAWNEAKPGLIWTLEDVDLIAERCLQEIEFGKYEFTGSAH